MPRDARDISGGLERKGFKRRNADDAFYHLLVNGKKTAVWTKISHGEREIHDGLLSTMARQLKLTKRLFMDLVDCPMSLEAYLAHLRAGGHIAG